MNSTARCPQCGTELQNPGSPQELCPACLLKLGLSGAVAAAPDEPESHHPEPGIPDLQKHTSAPDSVTSGRPSQWRLLLTLSALLLGALAACAWARTASRPPGSFQTRLSVITPETTDRVSIAISPDGRKIVFAAVADGRSVLWIRPMDSLSARPLAGTEGGFYPFWSPDSRWVGFFADRRLKRVAIDGSPPQTLARAPHGCGGAWNAERVILFAPDCEGPLFQVSAEGGEPVPSTSVEAASRTGHRFPQFLPDGRHFLFFVAGEPGIRGVYAGDLGSRETRRLLNVDTAAVYASSGHLLFARQGILMAQPFDPKRLEVTGNPFPVAEQVTVDSVDSGHALAAVSASAAGPIVYRAGRSSDSRQLLHFDRSGGVFQIPGEPIRADEFALSPDGRYAAIQRTVNGNTDIWLMETARGVLRRLTFDPGVDAEPLWSPDGERIVFRSTRNGSNELYQKPASGVGDAEPLHAGEENGIATDWSPDGRFLLYQSVNPETGWDIRALPLEGDQEPIPLLQTTFDEVGAQFSPDGNWVAYQSDESGRFEIYLRSFPEPTVQLQVTTTGGTQVAWSRDGRELFYVAPEGLLMAVPIRGSADNPIAGSRIPGALFPARIGAAAQSPFRRQYAVSPDGIFLINTVVEEATSPLTVILGADYSAPRLGTE